MSDLRLDDYEIVIDGLRMQLAWMASGDAQPDRVRAVAFDEHGQVLLVRGQGSVGFTLPGGGVELGELPVVALARELFEEASARMVACEPLGVCRFRDPDGRIDHHGFYWARVVLGDGWVASEEIAEFRLVEPDEFLDALEWGRSDPKAEVLLQLALEREAVQRW